MSLWESNLLEEMERMRREMDRFLGQAGLPAATLPFSRISFLPGRAPRAYPLLNIAEDKDAFLIDALAPGVDSKTLDVSITGNQLTITGEKKALEGDIKPEAVHRNERASGRFLRTVTLTADVDSSRVQANYGDGLLRITLPKAESGKARKIQVKLS